MRTYYCVLVILSLLCLPAYGACQGPTITSGWGASFYNTSIVTGFTYDMDKSILYPTFKNITYAAFVSVPYGTAQQFANSRTPDTFYQNQVYAVYHQALQQENCTLLLSEAGGIILAR